MRIIIIDTAKVTFLFIGVRIGADEFTLSIYPASTPIYMELARNGRLADLMQNVAALVSKAVDLDKEVMKTVAAYRGGVAPEDVRAVAHDVLRHRVGLSYEAEANNVTAEEIVSKIINKVEVP